MSARIVTVPREHIEPFSDQPREYFDEGELNELAVSIKENGQLQPVLITENPQGSSVPYKLIDGQRRWLAIGIAGVLTVDGIVRQVTNEKDRFIKSVIANLSRSPNTPLEVAKSFERIMAENEMTVPELARKIGKSQPYVYQYLALRRLHPTVRARLEPTVPEAERITFPIAYQLSTLPPDVQIDYLASIKERGLRGPRAVQMIRQTAQIHGHVSGTGRRPRVPADDYNNLAAFLERTVQQATLFDEAPEGMLEKMFTKRTKDDVDTIIAQASDIQARMNRLYIKLRAISKGKSPQ